MIRSLVSVGLAGVALAVAGAVPAAAQEPGVVRGRVIDRASGTPFAGAYIGIAGVAHNVLTDSAGQYVLPQAPAGSRHVEVTIAGYGTVLRTTTVVPHDTTLLDFDLLPAAIEPDLVLDGVAGGPARRRDVGQSVAVITGKELEATPATTLTEALQGRLPGVLVLDASGWAGVGRQVQMRGAGSFSNTDRPLVFVDGVRVADVPYPAGPESTQALDPLDDIDPATIDRIEVTRGPPAGQRYGREGANGVIQVFTRRGGPGRPAWSFSTDQGAEWLGHIGPGGASNPDGLGLNDCRLALGCPASNTWLRTGRSQRYRASVSGGGRGVLAGYFASGTWGREAGVIAPQNSLAGSGHGTLTLRPLSSLEITAGGAYARHDVRWIPGGFLTDVLTGPSPVFPGLNDSLYLLADVDQRASHASAALNVTWTPLAGLWNHLALGWDRAQSRYRDDEPGGIPDSLIRAALTTEGFGLRTLTADYQGSWTLSLGRVASRLSWSAGLRKETLADSTYFASGGASAWSGLHATNTIRGFSVQERVGVEDRLFLTGGVRWDDATQIDTTGLEAFPAAQLSYLVSEDAFWPRWWDAFQVRLAIARAGQVLSPMALPQLASLGGYVVPGLRPERGTELEAGFQSAMFGGRMGLEYTYYAQHTSNVMALVAVAGGGFFNTYALANVGTISNRGHEVLLDVSVLRGPVARWDVGALWSTNHSEASDVGSHRVAIFPNGGGVVEEMRDSVAAPCYYGSVVTNPDAVGVTPTFDLAGRMIGPTYPTFSYGLTTRLGLGRISLSLLGEGQGGSWLPFVTAWESVREKTWPGCYDVQDALAAGDTTGLTAGQRAACDPRYASLASWTFPAGFFRLRYASLTVRLPERWLPGVHRAWLGLTARNLVLLTNYPGLDPEAITGGSTEGTFGNGFRSESFELPHARSVELTLKLDL